MDPGELIGGLCGSAVLLAIVVGLAMLFRSASAESDRSRKVSEDARRAREQGRWDRLCAQFGPEAAAKIWNGDIWQGMTEAMLVESVGQPADMDRSVLKTKTKATWKYAQTARNRYAVKVYLEDGLVVGWDL